MIWSRRGGKQMLLLLSENETVTKGLIYWANGTPTLNLDLIGKICYGFVSGVWYMPSVLKIYPSLDVMR